jgi:hypothetical protein
LEERHRTRRNVALGARAQNYIPYERSPQIEVKNDTRVPFREANGTTPVDFRPIFCPPLDERETLDDLGTALAFAKESFCEMESCLTVLIFAIDWKNLFKKKTFPRVVCKK